jgi:hypothetical protein
MGCVLDNGSIYVDPFTKRELDLYNIHHLNLMIDYMQRNLVSSVNSRIEDKVICKVTLADPYIKNKDLSDDIINCLLDVRCQKINPLDKAFNSFDTNLYLTPNFLQHFDFTGITDKLTLKKCIKFLAGQLCLNITETSTGSKEDFYKPWFPNQKFECVYYDVNKKEGMLTENLCKCNIRYRRSDPEDENSPYILVSYYPFHCHPIHSNF